LAKALRPKPKGNTMKFYFLAIAFSIFFSPYARASETQICRDGIGSMAVIENRSGQFKVSLTGPIVQEMIRRSLVYSGTSPTTIEFQAPLSRRPFGSRIVVSDLYLTRIASWQGSGLLVEASGGERGESLSWQFRTCQR